MSQDKKQDALRALRNKFNPNRTLKDALDEKGYSIRYWGAWETNPYEEDDDFPTLTDRSFEKADAIVERISKEYGVKVNYCISEKYWLDFYVK